MLSSPTIQPSRLFLLSRNQHTHHLLKYHKVFATNQYTATRLSVSLSFSFPFFFPSSTCAFFFLKTLLQERRDQKLRMSYFHLRVILSNSSSDSKLHDHQALPALQQPGKNANVHKSNLIIFQTSLICLRLLAKLQIPEGSTYLPHMWRRAMVTGTLEHTVNDTDHVPKVTCSATLEITCSTVLLLSSQNHHHFYHVPGKGTIIEFHNITIP